MKNKKFWFVCLFFSLLLAFSLDATSSLATQKLGSFKGSEFKHCRSNLARGIVEFIQDDLRTIALNNKLSIKDEERLLSVLHKIVRPRSTHFARIYALLEEFDIDPISQFDFFGAPTTSGGWTFLNTDLDTFAPNGEKIENVRKALNLSKAAFAKALGVSYNAADRWERFDCHMEAQSILALYAIAARHKVYPNLFGEYSRQGKRVKKTADSTKIERVLSNCVVPDKESLRIIQERELLQKKPQERGLLERKVDTIGFKFRTVNVLKKNGIQTLGILMQYSQDDLAMLGGCGKKTVENIVSVLSRMQLSLPKLSR